MAEQTAAQTRTGYRTWLSRTSILAIVGWTIAVAGVALLLVRAAPASASHGDGLGARDLLAGAGVTRVYDGTHTTISDSLASFDQTVRLSAADEGTTIDRTALECHGGRADITWHVGNLEPTVAGTGIHLSATFDGEVIGSMIAGSSDGIWNDRPAGIRAVVACSPGTHQLAIQVVSVNGLWGIPYVVNPGERNIEGLRVNRGFVVTEVWG